MAVIVDNPVFRPDIGVHYNFSPSHAARARRGDGLCNASVPAPARNRPRPLEARWAVGDDGRLACSWIRISPA